MKRKSTKSISKRVIRIIPHISLMSKMGEGGHTLYEAMGEFIDNSIDAMTELQRAGLKKLVVRLNLSVSKKTFSITDNGRGMDEETIKKASVLGDSKKTDGDLGTYGVGMNTAAMSLSNAFTVRTGMEGESKGFELTYEYDMNGDWEADLETIEIEPEAHGTTIEIAKVNKINLTAGKIQYLKSDLAKRYRSFISNGNVEIYVNRVKVRVEDIEWMDGYPKDFKINTEYGKIYGKIGLMKESSQKGYYGFDMFRNKRMIITNSKFAIGEHSTIARIAGEIHLDFVKVTHQKNQFKTDTVEYETAEKACKEHPIFKKLMSEARKKLQEGVDKKENNELSIAIHDKLPIISQALQELMNEDIDVPWGKGGKGIGKKKKGRFSIDILKNLGKVTPRKYNKDQEPQTTETKEKKEKKDEVREVDVVEVSGRSFKIKEEFINDKNMGRKSTQYDENEGVLTIYYNKGYAGYKATKDTLSYTLETTNDAIVEFLYTDHQKVVAEVNETKESLLTKTIRLSEAMRHAETKGIN